MFEGTEAEWLAGRHDMIYHKSCRSIRKRRLLACAHARRALGLLQDERFHRAVETSEHYADGETTAEALKLESRARALASDPKERLTLNDYTIPCKHV